MGGVSPARQLGAVAIAVVPLAALLVWMRTTRDQPMEAWHLMVYPMVFGGGAIVLILGLLALLCRQRPGELNLQKATVSRDLLHGLALFAGFAVLAVVQQFTVARWFPQQPAPEIASLVEEMSRSPLMMALWLGPVVWIGVACFEELIRVFVLSRLWLVWPGPAARWTAVVASAVLFGAAHIYQGTAGFISTGIMGFIAGWYYLSAGRVWPLIISHALYDSAWIAFGVIMIRRGQL